MYFQYHLSVNMQLGTFFPLSLFQGMSVQMRHCTLVQNGWGYFMTSLLTNNTWIDRRNNYGRKSENLKKETASSFLNRLTFSFRVWVSVVVPNPTMGALNMKWSDTTWMAFILDVEWQSGDNRGQAPPWFRASWSEPEGKSSRSEGPNLSHNFVPSPPTDARDQNTGLLWSCLASFGLEFPRYWRR